MTKLIEKPSLPADDDCCGGGACCPCVWDFYYAEHKKWRLQQVEIQADEKADKEISSD
ncbi:MAG: hypothetical protein ACI9YH_002946 [Colwellia sp.]|jgi:hypothetical protein